MVLRVCQGIATVLREASGQRGSASRDALQVNRLLEKHASRGKLEPLERLRLAAHSAKWALSDPYQGTGVALLGEVTGEDALRDMRARMLETEQGRNILKNRIPVFGYGDTLSEGDWKEGSVGRLLQHCVPEERVKVTLIEDSELAFVMRRYRDAHDVIHALTGFPVTVSGEIALKWYESAATRLPMTTLSATFGLLRVEPNSAQLLAEWLPWAALAGRRGHFYMGVQFDKYFEMDVDEFRAHIMKWPRLPKSVKDKALLRDHYRDAVEQATREGRDAKALKDEIRRIEADFV